MSKGIFALIFLLSFTAQAKSKGSKYPVVQFVQGQVFQVEDVIHIVKKEVQRTEKNKPVKKGMVFKDKALLKTNEKSEVRIALNAQDILVIRENSFVMIPEIAWKDGGVSQIILKAGALRYLCRDQCERKFVTALYEGVLPAGDYLLKYQPEAPEVELSVVSGAAGFGGLENETVITLNSEERAAFRGMLDENNQPAYDVLLKGRKVAKGKLLDTQKIAKEEISDLQKQEAIHIQKVKAKPKSKRLASQICDKPWGELNQCAWVCEKNKKKAKSCQVEQGAVCVRMRCNANGEWSDRQELSSSQSQCQVQPIVGTCNY